MNLTLKKVFRDMRIYKGRTLLSLASVLMGTAAVGAVLSAYAILSREMQRNFMDTNPASMTLAVSNLDGRAEEIVRNAYPDTVVDVSKTVQARVSRGDGTWGSIVLRAVPSLGSQKVDTFDLEKGRWAADPGQMMLERDCLKILPNLKTGAGEKLTVALPGQPARDMLIAGTVHAPALAPASMEKYSYGFVTLDALKGLGYAGGYDELRIVSLKDRMDQNAMRAMAMDVKGLLASNGYAVSRVDVPMPGKHPHADQLSSLLFLLQAFAVIALLAACLIIVNLMNFIMSRQARQIAVQKAMGGTGHQIAAPYFAYVLMIGLGAVALSLPLAAAVGRAYAAFATGILNFDILSSAIPAWVYAAQIATGLAATLLASAWPVLRSCSASVKDGLTEKIAAPRGSGRQRASRRGGVASSLPAGNLTRRPARAVLAALALASGGVLFMTAQNITASIGKTVDVSMAAFKWDYNITLAGNYDKAVLDKTASAVKGLKDVEVWQGSTGFFKTPAGPDSPAYPVKIAPAGTKMLDLPGLDSAGSAIIVNKALADAEGWMAEGGTVTLQAGAKSAQVKLLPVVTEVPAIPAIYMSAGTYARLFGDAPRQVLMATADTRDYMGQRAITKDIEATFKDAGVVIADNWNIYVLRLAFVEHLNVIVTFFSAMAILAVAVGGLGIGSSIGISVSERRHETGVLRAVGATPRRVYALVLAEVLLLGLIGWLAGALLSWPVSLLVGNYFGQIFLHTNLASALSVQGGALWLAISLGVALAAGFLPARAAARSPLREMLAYE